MGVETDLRAALVLRLEAQAVGAGYTANSVAVKKAQESPAGGFPYITFGEMVVSETHVDEVDTVDVLVRLHSWSRQTETDAEVLQMQGEIRDALHDYQPTLTRYGDTGEDWRCFSLLRETTRSLPDPDGSHGVCEYRALIERV